LAWSKISSYAGQSFRIGAAIAVAQAGLEDSTIRALVVHVRHHYRIRICVHYSTARTSLRVFLQDLRSHYTLGRCWGRGSPL